VGNVRRQDCQSGHQSSVISFKYCKNHKNRKFQAIWLLQMAAAMAAIQIPCIFYHKGTKKEEKKLHS
jgi:hypothetical protein